MSAANDLSRIRELILPDLDEFANLDATIQSMQNQQTQTDLKLAEANRQISLLSEQVARLERQNASLSKLIQEIEERESSLLTRFGKKLSRRD